MLTISAHAIDRAMERLPGVRTEAAAIAALDTPATRKAAEIGAPFVKVGTGQHIVIRNSTVVTVFPKEKHLSTLRLERDPENRMPPQGEV